MLARQRLLDQKATIWQALAYEATNKRKKNPKDDLSFDSDSYQIMVDNGASYSKYKTTLMTSLNHQPKLDQR